jgi:hypothetical protein
MPDIIPPVPWRLLVLDRSSDDPKWLLATVDPAAGVHRAELTRDGTVLDWPEITRWATEAAGTPVTLASMPDALAWQMKSRPQ